MVSLSALFRIRPAAVVCGGAAMVVAGAWLGPVTGGPAHQLDVRAASSTATTADVRLAASVTPLLSGPGGGLGGSDGDGSPGNNVAPPPGRHMADSPSSSGGSSSGGGFRSSESGPQDSVFKTVGHWLGLGGDDSAKSSAPAGPPKAHKPSADQAKESAAQDPAQAGPKQAKPGKAAGAASGDAKTASKGSSGPDTGGILQSVFSGVSHLLSGIFGL
jgi:hypothetical protein